MLIGNSALFIIFILSLSRFSLAGQGVDAFADRAVQFARFTETLQRLSEGNQTLVCDFRQLPISTTSAPIALFSPMISVLPVEVLKFSKTGAAVASAVSIASVSPGSVTQASRISATLNVLVCDVGNSLEDSSLGWSDNPTFLTLGNSTLKSYNGAVLGNWLLTGSLAGLHTLVAKKWSGPNVRYPGLLILPVLFLLPPTTKEAMVMARFGNTAERIPGIVSLIAQVAGTGVVTRFLLPSQFRAEFVKHESGEGKWIDLGSQKEDYDGATKGYVNQYGLFFKDYREGRQWFLSIELLMSMATGVIDAYGIDPSSTCSSLIYGATGVYGVYAGSLILFYPHDSKLDRIYFGATAAAQFAALAIGSAQRASALQSDSNSTLQKVAIGIPVALQWASVGRAVFDVGMLIWTAYKAWQNLQHPAADMSDMNDMNDSSSTPMLTVPQDQQDVSQAFNPLQASTNL